MSEIEKPRIAEAQTDPPVTEAKGQRTRLEVVGIFARLFVGGLFIYMGVMKALKPEEFLILVRQYEMVSIPWILNSIAAALPWFEIFCGLLLVAGIAVRGTALAVFLMLAPFTLIVLRRALTMSASQAMPLCAIEFDCGCGNGIVPICPKLLENCLLMFLAAWLISGRGKQFSVRFALFRNRNTPAAAA